MELLLLTYIHTALKIANLVDLHTFRPYYPNPEKKVLVLINFFRHLVLKRRKGLKLWEGEKLGQIERQ